MHKSDGTTTVLTAFNQEAWDRSGLSWLASLLELAKYDGNICIVADGLNQKTTRFLQNHQIQLIVPSRKFKDPNLDCFCTAMSAVNCTSAYWHNTSYYQSSLDELMEIAAKDLVASLGSSPRPMVRDSLGVFGFNDTDSQMSLYQTLLKVARWNGTVLTGSFVAGPKEKLSYLGKFVEFHVERGYLNDARHAVDIAMNLFYLGDSSFVIDNSWNNFVDSGWTWRGKFYRGDDAIKVVSFHDDVVFSAICARFHLVNCYRDLYASWHTKYRDQMMMPRLLLKRDKDD